MMLDQVKNLTHQVRLFGIHEACERRAQEALSKQLHSLEFLRLLLEDELLSRKDRTAKALTTKAHFRFRADLEDWDLSFHKDVPKAKISELSQLSFFHNLENLLILGKTGRGGYLGVFRRNYTWYQEVALMVLSNTSTGPSLLLMDRQGNIRALLGASLELTGIGAVNRRAESSLALFDKKGELIWSAP